MLTSYELIFSAFLVLNAFLFFYSPLIVFIVCVICFIIIFKLKYNAIKSLRRTREATVGLRPESGLISSHLNYGQNSNIRVIKSARRQLPLQSRNANKSIFGHNLMSKFDTIHTNPIYFGKSEGLVSSQLFSPIPQSSPNQMSYQTAIYNMRDTYSYELPNSQLGNIPRVRLSPTSESMPHELNLKNKALTRPVTVRIAPMPTDMSSKFTLSRLSSLASSTATTFAIPDTNRSNPSTQTKSIVEALKLKRKRGQKYELETEETFKLSSNKKAKRDAFNSSNVTINGLMPSVKPSVKRSIVGTPVTPKRVKNNEIFSSYSSLQKHNLSPTLVKSKRKLSPESSDRIEVKTKRSLIPDNNSMEAISPSNSVTTEDIKEVEEVDEPISLLINTNEANKAEESSPKKCYGLPLHLHTMEDHEHDRNKAKKRLSRYLNAIHEVTSPKTKQKVDEVITTLVTQANSTSEIALPSVPAAAIFTNSRVETSVTTTLLNTPISSVSTTSRESVSPQTHVVSADHIDNSGNCSMTSAPNSPEVSSITTPFNNSITSQTPSIGVTKSLSAENSIKFGTTLNDSNASKATIPVPSIPSTQFGSISNMFSSPISTSSTQTVPTFSLGNSSSAAPIPQFSSPISSSAPLPIPTFSQKTITFNSQPTLTPFPNAFASEAATPGGLFSVGASSQSSRRIAQSSRNRRPKR